MNKRLVCGALRAFGVALSVMPATALAQGEMSDVEIESSRLAPGIYMLTGRGGNIGVSAGEDGVFLIDDQFAPLTEKIRAAVAALHDGPVRFVINTHWHRDHTGGNENFAEAGAVIVAHENVRERMSVPQVMERAGRTVEPSPSGALPVVTFTRDLTLHLNGEPARVIHLAAAHTDGDAVVHFTGSNVLHAGDIFFNGMYPFIDVDSGGSVDGMIAAADELLAMTDADTKIIPGHGPLASRDDLRGYRDMLATVRDGVRAMIEEGRTLEEIKAAGLTADFDARYNRLGFFEPERWVEMVYGSLAD